MIDFEQEAQAQRELLTADRRYLHAHPECGMELPGTKAYLRARLSEVGISCTECGGGLVATLGTDGPCILLRADMDALPVQELNDLPYRCSEQRGHMCGHDLHMAILLEAARLLKRHEDTLPCRVKLMLQPGEELMEGCSSMLEAGVLEAPAVDAAISLHVISNREDGLLTFKKGSALSSADILYFQAVGVGGHGSMPELTKDPIRALVKIYEELDSLIPRTAGMFQSAAVSIGNFEAGGGTIGNIIPQSAKMTGTLRCYDNALRQQLLERVREITRAVSMLTGVTCTVETKGCPVVENDPALCSRLAPYLFGIKGLTVREEVLPANISEDYSFLSCKVPSVYLLLGVGSPEVPFNHNPKARFSERYLPEAAAAIAAAAYGYGETAADLPG